MKAILKWTGVAMVALLLATLAQTMAGDAKAPPSAAEAMKMLAEAGKPGAEHKKLDPLVGTWSVTLKLWTDPNQPPAEAKGTFERKWIMDGRFLQETGVCECASTGKKVEGTSLIGYDAGLKKYTCVKACGLTGQIVSSTATCDSTGMHFTATHEDCCPLTHQMVKGRDEIVIESADRIVVTMYKTIDGREVKFGEVVQTRVK